MQATVELPDAIVEQIEFLATAEGITAEGFIRRLVTEHLKHHRSKFARAEEVRLPLIPIQDTGPIRRLMGSDLADLFSSEDVAS